MAIDHPHCGGNPTADVVREEAVRLSKLHKSYMVYVATNVQGACVGVPSVVKRHAEQVAAEAAGRVLIFNQGILAGYC